MAAYDISPADPGVLEYPSISVLEIENVDRLTISFDKKQPIFTL